MIDEESLARVDTWLTAAVRPRTGPVEVVRVRPWGTVWSAPTDQGRVWIKRPGPDNLVETDLLPVLAGLDVPLVPVVLGAGDGLVVLADAGRPFREVYAGDAFVPPFTAALVDLGTVQRSAATRVPELLTLGLTDLRPPALPDRFDELVDALGPVADARVARAALVDVAASLAASVVPVSIDHNDLHADNLLVDTAGRITAVDWGDSVVAHPFATLHVPSRALADAVGGDVDAAWDIPAVAAARRRYLAGFAPVAAGEDLERTARLASLAAPVVRAWIWRRAATSAERIPGRDDDVRRYAAQARTWLASAVTVLRQT